MGEGCVWDPRDNCFYWTDIEESRIYRLNAGGDVNVFPLPERAAFILPRQRPGFVIGFASRIATSDAELLNFMTLRTIEPDLPQTRVNDATVDPQGGVIFGTFDERDRQPVAALYRLAPDGGLTRLFGEVTVSNGLAFSPPGDTLYFADTPVGIIRRFRAHAALSSFEEMEPLAGGDVAPGAPDGATVDSAGCYWNARVRGGCLVRLDVDGRLVERIDLPVRGPTCVALGGPGLTELFATTLRVRHTEEDLRAAPQAGGVFSAMVDVPGIPQRLCNI